MSSARNAGESAICPMPAHLCGDRACRVREMQARVRFVPCPRNPLRRSCASSARNAGQTAICPVRAQPSAEIVRVECAKCRRDCDLSGARATLCGDRACRVREMQARLRFVRCARNPLRRSCVSSARSAGESVICPMCAQPSAEIVRVERFILDAGNPLRRSCFCSATLVRGVSGELEDENWRLCSTTLVRGVSGELEDENW